MNFEIEFRIYRSVVRSLDVGNRILRIRELQNRKKLSFETGNNDRERTHLRTSPQYAVFYCQMYQRVSGIEANCLHPPVHAGILCFSLVS
jgi:hypothetical protein